MFRTKKQRLEIVLDISKKLKQFSNANLSTCIDLYNSDFTAIKTIRDIFRQYIHQDDSCTQLLVGFSGSVHFPEMGRTIQYKLPIKSTSPPQFVFKKRF